MEGGMNIDGALNLEEYNFFVILKDENHSNSEETVFSFLKSIKEELRERSGHMYVDEHDSCIPQNSDSQAVVFLYEILNKIANKCSELTCVIEPSHVDDVYRDLYQTVYAKEHFDLSRECIRLSLFNKSMDAIEYLGMNGRVEDWERHQYQTNENGYLQKFFIGSIVLTPVKGGVVGRTLIDPKWIIDSDISCALRLSDYPVTIRGKRLYVSAFPYRKQDDVVLSCAELSILNLLCYYSNEFSDYPYTMPRALITHISSHASERIMPTRGQPYHVLSRLLRHFKFEPRRYSRDDVESQHSQFIPDVPYGAMKQLMQCYIESGIPFCIGIMPRFGGSLGHSLICIGIEQVNKYDKTDVDKIYQRDTTRAFIKRENGRICYDSNHYPIIKGYLVSSEALTENRRFITIDDSKLPYSADYYNSFSDDMQVSEILVPLTNSMALDAINARSTAISILESEKYGLISHTVDLGCTEDRYVYTLRLTTVRSLLRWRVAHEEFPSIALTYSSISLPSMVWLIEVFCVSDWIADGIESKRAIGEIILDATTNSRNPFSLLVFARWPNLLYYRNISGDITEYEMEDYINDAGRLRSFISYDRNLRHIKPV